MGGSYFCNSPLLNFICRYIPLKQWDFDDSHSPKYQKFKVDELPRIISYEQDWKWNDLIPYYEKRYGKTIKPTFRRVECDIPEECTCPICNAHSLISHGMMVRKNHRFAARSVLISTLHLKITESLKLISFVALIVLISLSL